MPFTALPNPEKEMGLSATLPPRPGGLRPLLPRSLWINTFPLPLARALPQVWRGAGSRLGMGVGLMYLTPWQAELSLDRFQGPGLRFSGPEEFCRNTAATSLAESFPAAS